MGQLMNDAQFDDRVVAVMQKRRLALRILSLLPPHEMEVFILRVMGMRQARVAEHTGKSPSYSQLIAKRMFARLRGDRVCRMLAADENRTAA